MIAFPVDINCDLGEGAGVEENIMPLIGSANIACGAHAGSPELMQHCLTLAMQHQVKIGIHPSYPDRENFGRKIMVIPTKELRTSLQQQIDLFLKIAEQVGAQIHHLKLHGALYNKAAKDGELTELIIDLLKEYHQPWTLYCPPNSHLQKSASENGISTWGEAFLDRNYAADGSLAPRQLAQAIIRDPELVLTHFKNMLHKKKVFTLANSWIPMDAQTYCIHGDHPESLSILNFLIEAHQRGEI